MRTAPVMLLLLALLAGCARPEAPAQTEAASAPAGVEILPEAPPAADAPASPAAQPYLFETSITDAGFEHARLDAATQATIRWHNKGAEVHSVVSDEGTFRGSGPIAQGASFEYTFQAAGDHAYHCRYHPEMRGIVVVR